MENLDALQRIAGELRAVLAHIDEDYGPAVYAATRDNDDVYSASTPIREALIEVERTILLRQRETRRSPLMDDYYITIDCRRTPATYATRSDAYDAALSHLAQMSIGTVAAIWTNTEQTDRFAVKRTRRGMRVTHTAIAA